jgi:hypothetical protein
MPFPATKALHDKALINFGNDLKTAQTQPAQFSDCSQSFAKLCMQTPDQEQVTLQYSQSLASPSLYYRKDL